MSPRRKASHSKYLSNRASLIDGGIPRGLGRYTLSLFSSPRTAKLERNFAAELVATLNLDSREAFFYSSARAAFLDYIVSKGIGKGDEVLLPASTCSVMVEIVLASGASPTFYDIEEETYSGNLQELIHHVTSRTRAVVIQHSFGIPSPLVDAVPALHRLGLVVVEDCAVGIGSSRNGRVIGSFGDATILSFGHSKPINGFLGGALLVNFGTNGLTIGTAKRLSVIQRALSFFFMVLHHCFANRRSNQAMNIANLGVGLGLRLGFSVSPYLRTRDSSTRLKNPQQIIRRMPRFALVRASLSLSKWADEISLRREILQRYLHSVSADSVPKAYFDPKNEIEPFRLLGYCKRKDDWIGELDALLDTSQVWFRAPIVAAEVPLSALGYEEGSCPSAEKLSPTVYNLPTWISEKQLLNYLAILTTKL